MDIGYLTSKCCLLECMSGDVGSVFHDVVSLKHLESVEESKNHKHFSAILFVVVLQNACVT